ncbi:MAG: hypothetical protein CMG69_03910 [Candidatus Marinimicrobia bacterium]|nr:hypothetical protein [Candidatus Neomarinimicrobiota bacterium]|tara:strand:+ start:54800 stop:55588 length:789 start_codon:yes stop_codon:yes gene_type:complete
MELNLNNQTILITGSSRGIGRGIAEEFLKEEAIVFVTGRKDKNVENTSSDLSKLYGSKRVQQFIGDLNNQKILNDLKKYIIKKTEGLNHLVCNIGSGSSVPPLREDINEFQRMLDINLLNAVGAVNQLFPLLETSVSKASCFPSITFIGSICGVETLGCPVAYASAKSALVSYAKNISLSLGKRGIRVNTVTPGNIMFPESTWDKKIKKDKKKVEKMLKDEVPLECFGSVQDIASVVVFIASEKAKFVNGANWVIDGGQTRS